MEWVKEPTLKSTDFQQKCQNTQREKGSFFNKARSQDRRMKLDPHLTPHIKIQSQTD